MIPIYLTKGDAMNKLIGYARVSTPEQDLQLQIDALIEAGCNPQYIFTDKASGKTMGRKGLTVCLEHVQEGDTLMVWRIDRLGRSTQDLIKIVNDLKKRGVHFKSICESSIDTTSVYGELLFTMIGAFARAESEYCSERTRAGHQVARNRGIHVGRPVMSENNLKFLALKSMHEKGMSLSEITKNLKVSRYTVWRYKKLLEEQKLNGSDN